MQFGQPAHQRQPDPQAALGAVDVAAHLGEHVEHGGKRLGRDANPGVAHRHQRLPRLGPGRHRDAPAGRGVLGRVVEQVAEHLDDAGGVGVEFNRLLRQMHLEVMAAGLDQGDGGLERHRHQRRQRHRLFFKFDLAARDAGDVEQVVHQVDQVAELAVHHADQAVQGGRLGRGDAQQVEAGADRRQRIAQFVRQGGEEFGLAVVRFRQVGGDAPQFVLGALLLGDVARDGGQANDVAGVVAHRETLEVDRRHGAGDEVGEAQLALPARRRAGQGRQHHFLDEAAAFGREKVDQGVVGNGGVGRHAGQLAPGRIEEHADRVGGGDADEVGRLLGHRGQAADAFLGKAALGLVAEVQGDAAVRRRAAVDLEPAPEAIVIRFELDVRALLRAAAQAKLQRAAGQRGEHLPERRAGQAFARHAEQRFGSRVGVADAPVAVDRDKPFADALEDVVGAVFGRHPFARLVALADRQRGGIGEQRQGFMFVRVFVRVLVPGFVDAGGARLAPVPAEHAKHRARRRQDRYRAAAAQAVRQRQVAKDRRDRIVPGGGDVVDADHFAAGGRRQAWPVGLQAIDRVHEPGRQRRPGGVAQARFRALAVGQHDRRQRGAARIFLGGAGQHVEHVAERGVADGQLERAALALRQQGAEGARGDVDAVHQHARHRAVYTAQRDVDEVDEALLERTAAGAPAQQHALVVAFDRLAAGVDCVDQFAEALAVEFRQGVTQGPADQFALPHQLQVALVDELETMLRSAHDAHERRRALENVGQPLAFGFDVGALAVQVDEHRDPGAQHHGIERAGDEVDCAERIRLLDRKLGGGGIFGGGEEYDRQRVRTRKAAHQGCRLEAVHRRHSDALQHHREAVVQQRAQRLFAGADRHQVLAEPGQHALQLRQVGRLIVHQQDLYALFIHVLS